MDLSIIIPYHNEGADFISATLSSIRQTIDIKDYEIIVVDDYSDIPLSLQKETVIRHPENRGVGAAFDTGVKSAKSANLFLMGSDVRFIKNNWASKMIQEIKSHPKTFTCSNCVIINKDNMDIQKRISEGKVCNGATILMFHDNKTNPRKHKNFKSIIEAQWLPKIPEGSIDSFEIPCILGAAYGVSKDWYNYVDGWAGHIGWGTLEPYISLKSWMFGGSCRLAPDIYTGHIFKPTGTHGISQRVIVYNKLFTASVLLPDAQRLIDFFIHTSKIKEGMEMMEGQKELVEKKKQEYKDKTVIDIFAFCKKWDIDYRLNGSEN